MTIRCLTPDCGWHGDGHHRQQVCPACGLRSLQPCTRQLTLPSVSVPYTLTREERDDLAVLIGRNAEAIVAGYVGNRGQGT